MADYWKSQPRKHCDFCDCWIADNKPSIDFHERGKRHKENVEKKIAELRKQGQEKYKQQEALAETLKKMEEDALKKFQQDIDNDPVLSAKYKAVQAKAAAQAEADAKNAEQSETDHNTASGSSTEQQEQGPVWYEGTTPEGHVYYWNSVTQESKWEKPPDFDGVSSYSDQQDTNTANTETKSEASTEDEDKEEDKESKTSEEDKSEEFADRRPEKRKSNAAYGSWETVEYEEPVDLELPENRRVYQEYVPRAAQYEPREKLKFKEKTVTSLSGNSSADSNEGFKKKRKFGGNVRKRDTTA
ncbi:WW domain-binding protein 4-like [Amphiura filiformis]|uniref:WW domain-binding protein 4-like n=1 Tax=Amphiura filiformis TaxID=82378 RepID=UPI003B20EFA7